MKLSLLFTLVSTLVISNSYADYKLKLEGITKKNIRLQLWNEGLNNHRSRNFSDLTLYSIEQQDDFQIKYLIENLLSEKSYK